MNDRAGGSSRTRCAAIAVPVLAAWLAASTFAQAPERVALTEARVLPISGPPIENATVLIERGKIKEVGRDVAIPFDARVFKLKGKTIMPGMINPDDWRGLDTPNESRPVTAHLDAFDAIDPSRLFFEDELRLGITAIHTLPAGNCTIGGIGRVVRPIGLSPAEMVFGEGEFLKVSVSPRGGADRIVQLGLLRETFRELQDYQDRLAEKRYEEKLKEDEKDIDVGPEEAKKRGRDLIRAQDIDEEHRNLLRLTGGKVKVLGEEGPQVFEPLGAFIECAGATDVGAAVRIARDNGFIDRTVLCLGPECYKAIDEIKESGRPVVLPGNLVYEETDPLTGKRSETFVVTRFADAGVKFALSPGSNSSLPERMLTYQAARCVREGVRRDVALKAITLNAAEIIGQADRLGSIEAGKDGTVVVFSGDPLDFSSVIEMVFIEGIPVYNRATDRRIQRLISHSDTPEGADDKPE
ncbi:MAG: amidohydrolase family protein [Phycisphaerales bacterium]|nr:amidohydrolase family protein [Phycisphaerales bacterium]